mmetsp:Transcript_80655/g.216147  ORF Transcript_80655/g.216147 Transcript_80655/m.216147 type:complete len:230 (-) Transcript_80655:5072-5761(-)
MTSAGGALQALLSSMLNSSMSGSLPISTGTCVMRFWWRSTDSSLVQRHRLRGTVVSQLSERSSSLSSPSRPTEEGSAWMLLCPSRSSWMLPRSPISLGTTEMRLTERSSSRMAVRHRTVSGSTVMRLALPCSSSRPQSDSKKPSGQSDTSLWLKRSIVRLVSLIMVGGSDGSSFLLRFSSVSAEQKPMELSREPIMFSDRSRICIESLAPICSGIRRMRFLPRSTRTTP